MMLISPSARIHIIAIVAMTAAGCTNVTTSVPPSVPVDHESSAGSGKPQLPGGWPCQDLQIKRPDCPVL
jgi:hypothetical protein